MYFESKGDYGDPGGMPNLQAAAGGFKCIEAACMASCIAYGRSVDGGCIFYDLRHGFITYARRTGVPRNVVMAITGHSRGRGDMNRRYDQVDDADLLKAIDTVERYFPQILTQILI